MSGGREPGPDPHGGPVEARPEPDPTPLGAGRAAGAPLAAAVARPGTASPFGRALLDAGARHLAGEAGALGAFAQCHFPGLEDPRDRAAALLTLQHAVHRWLPAVPEPED